MARTDSSKKAARRATSGGLGGLSLLNPSFQKLLLALHSATDPKAFLKAAEQLIHAAIPCDVVHTLLHYSQDRRSSSVAWGSDGSVFTNEHVRASLVENPFTWLLTTRPEVRFQLLELCYPSAAQMEQDPFYKQFILGIGVQHATAMPFAGGDLVFAPQRAPGRAEVSRDEMAMMEALHPHIDAAYQRVNRLQTSTGALLSLEECVASLPLPTILLDWGLAPFFFNESAREAAARWRGIDPHLKLSARDFEVPPDLLAAINAMRETWTMALRDGAGMATLGERMVEHPRISGWRARLSMTTLCSPHFGKPSFIIRLETSQPDPGVKLAILARLSVCEQKLVQRVCNGESNQEIADALGRSLNTVKSELHSVFKKMEVPSRARLMALLR